MRSSPENLQNQSFVQMLKTNYDHLPCGSAGPITSGQSAHHRSRLCVYGVCARCPAEHLCSDLVAAYITSTRRSEVIKTVIMCHQICFISADS